jgi:hypothetical protein
MSDETNEFLYVKEMDALQGLRRGMVFVEQTYHIFSLVAARRIM